MIVLENGDLLEGDATSASEVDFTLHGLDNNALKQLADGQLASSKGTLYTADSTDVISSIILVNAGAAHNHVNLYLKPSAGASRRLIPKNLQLDPGYSLHFDGAKVMVLNTSGQIISAGATGATGETGPTGAAGPLMWTQTTGTFTAAPASTSTLTMTTDLTAIIIPGTPLKYKISTTYYYGICTAITSALLTIAGAPMGGNILELYYSSNSRAIQMDLVFNGYYEDATNPTLIATDLATAALWNQQKAYCVMYKVYSKVHDTGTHGKATVLIAGSDVNSSAGGLTIAADATWYSTVVDINTSNYDINYGEAIEVSVTKSGNGNATDLTVSMVFVLP